MLGERTTVVLSVEQIDSVPDLKKALAAVGYSANFDGTTYTAVQTELIQLVRNGAERVEKWQVTRASGWWDDHYLLFDQPIPSDARLMLDKDVPRRRIELAQAGTGRAWRETAHQLRHSSATVMLGCAGLSSAALPFRRNTSAAGYGFVISGGTSKGKTFVTRFAQSLIGHPDRLLTFRATGAGLEEMAQTYRHMPLVLDEPKSTHRGHRDAVQHIAYLLESGEPALRHSLWQGSPERIETIVMTGAEDGSLGDRSGGEQVRFIEIPCDLMGPFGIIDQHEEAGVTDHASAQRWIKEILAGLVDNHGHALRRFVAYLIGLGRENITHTLEQDMADFNQRADAELGPADAAARRARAAFAFVYASGLIAVDARVLPWSPEHIEACVLRCLGWHENRVQTAATPSSDVLAAREKLLASLRDHAPQSPNASCAALSKFGAVWDQRTQEVRATWDFLKGVVPQKTILDAVLRGLASDGLVRTVAKTGRWLQQVRYPDCDDGRLRVVCFAPEMLD
jgi:hypothetical protein